MTEDERNQLKRHVEERVAALKAEIDAAPSNELGVEASKDTLARLDQVLILLNDPDYGSCIECGNAIDVDRLVAVPESRVCSACAGE